MATPFTVIVPKDITDSNLVSSTITETGSEAAQGIYNSGSSYALNDVVIVTTGVHRKYKSLTGTANLNKYPPTNPTYWVDLGPTNKLAMFDQTGGTVTSSTTGGLEFVFTADRVNSMGFLDVNASSIRIRANDGVTTYYDQTYNLPDRAIVQNWYDYFYTESFRTTELIVKDIPPLSGSTYTVTITNTASNTSIGNFIYGSFSEIGNTQYGANVGIVDYSKKIVDEFGIATLVKRTFSKKVDMRIYVENAAIDAVCSKLNSLRATNCLWAGSTGVYESLTVFGFYKDYSIDISYPTYSVLSIQIEGLTQ